METYSSQVATVKYLQRYMLRFWFLLFAVCAVPVAAGDYSNHAEAQAFIDEMVEKQGMQRSELKALIDATQRRQSILDAIARPAEAKPWKDYRPIFLTDSRIQGGVDFWDQREVILKEVSQNFGVDPRIVVAIIGVETRYGQHAGRYRVLDALATLAFDYPPRSKFFRSELEQFLLLCREEDVDPRTALGSYAGAMGHGQFIASSYRRYAVDFDDDGRRDLWDSPHDIIGSVANYLHKHGWKPGAPIATRAEVNSEDYQRVSGKGLKPNTTVGELRTLGVLPQTKIADGTAARLIELEGNGGDEHWIVFNNFYVITRYNRSPLYAMAVTQLGDSIASRRRYRDTD